MAIRPILIIPDARLRAVCDPIVEIDDEIKTLAADMLETMYAAPGIGLAAPQIGVMKRIVTIDVANEGDEPAPYVMINPEITKFGEEIQVTEEGCLSIPELYYEVERPRPTPILTARKSLLTPMASWPSAFSTNSITSMAFSTSTI
jgi:peptide deformylase